MNLTAILGVVIVVIGAGAVGEGYLLRAAYEKQGKLQASNNAMADQLAKLNAIHKEMDKIHGTNNALPDSALFDSLLK